MLLSSSAASVRLELLAVFTQSRLSELLLPDWLPKDISAAKASLNNGAQSNYEQN